MKLANNRSDHEYNNYVMMLLPIFVLAEGAAVSRQIAAGACFVRFAATVPAHLHDKLFLNWINRIEAHGWEAKAVVHHRTYIVGAGRHGRCLRMLWLMGRRISVGFAVMV